MKYHIYAFLIVLGISSNAYAGYMEDVRNLGLISGEGIACNARRYKAYEMIARAYLVSSAQSDEQQEKGMYEYNTAKAEAYLRKRRDGYFDCDEINYRFDNQDILKSKLYKDGTLKMPDGKIITPRQAYDATLLYNKDDDERENLNRHYEKIVARRKAQANKEGIYHKIRQAEAKTSY